MRVSGRNSFSQVFDLLVLKGDNAYAKMGLLPICGLYTVWIKIKKKWFITTRGIYFNWVIQYNINTTKACVCIAINDIY